MSWNKAKEKKPKDSFWWGFIPSFLLPPTILIILFKVKYTTSLPIFEAIWKFSKTGLLGRELISCLLPCLVLFFVFYQMKKENATKGVFVGMAPSLVAAFILM
jgi:hypothetical protein